MGRLILIKTNRAQGAKAQVRVVLIRGNRSKERVGSNNVNIELRREN